MKAILLCLIVFLASCGLILNSKNASSSKSGSVPIIKPEISSKKIKIGYANPKYPKRTWSKTVTLPSKGRFVDENHYVTTQDKFLMNKLYPSSRTTKIKQHLERSYQVYKKYEPNIEFDELYPSSNSNRWTPAEGGKIGQGAVGKAQNRELTPEMEMWFLTMMWQKGQRPERGTKFLVEANGKAVVVIAGYEAGPSGNEYLGGLTWEVHQWLETDKDDMIKLSYLKNQDVPVGPVRLK